jgi:hypothetical protein
VDQKQLADLFVANDEFATLEAALDVFCPFESVGMVNQEIRHGYFLSYIFDPNRPHGFGTDCLVSLMRAATRTNEKLLGGLSLLDVHLMDFQNATVRREWNKIDILIDVPDQNLVVAIELKIDAKEHSSQLGRYRKTVETEWPNRRHLFLFLTKSGDDPSDDDGHGWHSVGLDQLASELSLIARKSAGDIAAKAMLDAYLAMLGRHHLNDEKLENLAASLWTKHREALEFLADRRPDAVGDLFKRLVDGREKLAEAIHAQCREHVIVDHHRPAAVYFAVPRWDSIPGFDCAEGFTPTNRLLLLELTKAGADYFRCYFIVGRGRGEMREKLFLQLKDAGADFGKKGYLTEQWNRLASIRISLKDIEDQDIDALSGKVFAQVREFAAKHIPIYTEAFKPLFDQP